MGIIDRYVWKEVAPPFAIGVGVFTFFLFIDRIYQLTNLVVTKNVPFHLVLPLLLFMLPPFFTVTLPMSILVAVLLSCGRLAGDLEVIALKSAGVSPVRLLRPFAVAGIVTSLLIACLTLVVNPLAVAAFQRQLFTILQTRAVSAVQEHTFSAAFGQLVLYVDELTPSQLRLKGILASDERDPQRLRIILAREGRLLSDEKERRITLRFLDGSINETAAGEPGRFRYTAFNLYDMSLPMESPLSRTGKDEKPELLLPLSQLLSTANTLAAQGQNAIPYYVELHKRFALPVAALVFVAVGYPLGIRSHRGGRAVALAASFGVVVSYYIVFTSMENFALGRWLPPGVAIWLPNFVFGLAAAVLMRTTSGFSPAWMETLWRSQALFVRWLPRYVDRPARPDRARARRVRRGPRASTFIIDRYLIRQYLFFIGISLVVGAALFIVLDLLQTLDRFLRVKPRMLYIMEHFAYNMPGELYKGLPLMVLISTIFLFVSLTRQRELEALLAAGVSLYRISLPILITSLLISVLAVFFQELALPALSTRAEEVDRVKIRGFLPRHLQRQGQVWYRSSDTRFLRLGLFDPVEKSMDDLLLLDIDRGFHLVRRLEARQARWTTKGWLLSDAVAYRIESQNRVQSEAFTSRLADMSEGIDDFTQVQKPIDTLSFVELRAFVAKLRESGHGVSKYLVQLYARVSFPLVHFIMTLVGIPFALASPRSGGRVMGIGVAIVIAIGYWIVHSTALAFAQADLLPPVLAAWTANIIFAGLGTALFLNART